MAVLALALMPTLSQALAHSRGEASRWAEVCTPQGMKQVLLQAEGGGEAIAPAKVANLFDHCAYCTLTPGVAPPPSPLTMADPGDLGGYLPPLFLQSPRSSFAWAGAQPRAPPSHS